MAEQQSSERDRRFFRIQDHVYLSYQPATDSPASRAASGADPMRELPNQLSALAHEARPVLRKLYKDHPEAAAAITLLDKKISLLAAALLSQSLATTGQTLAEVSLSASGIGFFSPQPLAKDVPLRLTLYLPPSLYKITAVGNVVYCKIPPDSNDGRYWIGVDFSELDVRDQEFLSGHVLKKQAEDIKQRRESAAA